MTASWEREQSLWGQGFSLVGGCDEVGRGPLAGPVVAAITVFSHGNVQSLKDSKTLTALKRQKLLTEILTDARAVGIGVVNNIIIDEINILNATKLAMTRAWRNLTVKADFLLVDALRPEELVKQVELDSVIRGDSQCASIAAASIVAKVYRDKLMAHYDKKYPVYGFAKNKGYPTREHLDALKMMGPCPLHRHSFRGVRHETS